MIRDATITRREDMARVIAVLQQAGQHHHVALYQAAYRGQIALTFAVDPTVGIKRVLRFAEAQKRPKLLVIGADGDAPVDASQWRCARGAMGWARAAVVHGTGPDPEPYRLAVALAGLFDRAVLVECTSQQIASWQRLVRPGTPGCLVKPPDGHVHPDPSLRGLH